MCACNCMSEPPAKRPKIAIMSEYNNLKTSLKVGEKEYEYFSLPALGDERVNKLPFSIRIVLESAIRNCDGAKVTKKDVESIVDWGEKGLYSFL